MMIVVSRAAADLDYNSVRETLTECFVTSNVFSGLPSAVRIWNRIYPTVTFFCHVVTCVTNTLRLVHVCCGSTTLPEPSPASRTRAPRYRQPSRSAQTSFGQT